MTQIVNRYPVLAIGGMMQGKSHHTSVWAGISPLEMPATTQQPLSSTAWQCNTLHNLIFSAVVSELLEEDVVGKAWARPRKLGAAGVSGCALGNKWARCKAPRAGWGPGVGDAVCASVEGRGKGSLATERASRSGMISGESSLGILSKNEGAVNLVGSKKARRGNFRIRARAVLCESIQKRTQIHHLLSKYHTLAL